MPERVTKFRCPICNAAYLVVRIEAAATDISPLLCLGCDSPLQDRDGKLGLAASLERVAADLKEQAGKLPPEISVKRAT